MVQLNCQDRTPHIVCQHGLKYIRDHGRQTVCFICYQPVDLAQSIPIKID